MLGLSSLDFGDHHHRGQPTFDGKNFAMDSSAGRHLSYGNFDVSLISARRPPTIISTGGIRNGPELMTGSADLGGSAFVPVESNASQPFNGIAGERKRISRPLTGRHVRHGTGASPVTLALLRHVLQERRRTRELNENQIVEKKKYRKKRK